MEFKIKKLGPSEANKLSSILKEYSCEALIKTGKYCIDGKSILGILSAMENEDLPKILEINELAHEKQGELTQKLIPFFEQ